MAPTARNLFALLYRAVDTLGGASTTPRLDAELLLATALGIPREELLQQPNSALATVAQQQKFARLLRRRRAGEPLAYLTGHKEFWGRDFLVTPDVLIPRPDSETLVTVVLEEIDRLSRPVRLLEVGTGSGCLGLTVAAERPIATLTLTDVSSTALAVATANARRLNVTGQVEFKQQDLLAGETSPYDILFANLPYVPEHWLTAAAQAPETRGLPFEPLVALTGGPDGLEIFRRFFEQLAAWTDRPPVIILEHGDGQHDELATLAQQLLPAPEILSRVDLTGQPRVAILRL